MVYSKEALKSILKKAAPILTNDNAEEFLNICEFNSFKNKEVIIRENIKATKGFLILKGIVRGYLLNNRGIEKNIILRSCFTFVGSPNTLFNNEKSRYTFEAIGKVELLAFEYSDLENLTLNNPNILKFHLSSYKEIIKTLIYRVESMINKMPEERYQDLLNTNPQFFETVYHKDIANYLGITPVSLSRIIKRSKVTLDEV
tara:strand:- start:692 stop:1294 length:603 start_codon:yes stop_codon:yes gene_type:complete